MEELQRATLKDNILRHLKLREQDKEVIFQQYIGGYESKNFEIVIEELLGLGFIETTSRTFDGHRLKITFQGNKVLENGGFVALYYKEVEAALKSSKREELAEKELNLKIRNNKWSLPLSIVGIVIALGTLVWSIYSRSNNVTEEQLNPKIDAIQNRLERLEKGLQQKDIEVKKLKEELLEADMMIKVLEETITPPAKAKV